MLLDENDETIKKEEIEKYVQEKLGLEKINKEDIKISDENLRAVLEGMKSVTTETRRNSLFSF